MSRLPCLSWFSSTVLLITLLGGCNELEQPQTYLVRDSAGIEIVESYHPAWGPGEEWRLSEEPVVTIGVATGEEEYELYDVASALHLSTGEIAVACGGTYEVRFYDSAGSYLRAVGRQGGGPEEFNLMWNMWRLGPDSLAVFDYRNTRITVLGLQGELGRNYIPTHPPGRGVTIPMGPFSDGSFLGRSHLAGGGGEPAADGVHRESVLLVRWSPEGDLTDHEVVRPGWEQFYRPLQGESMTAQPPFGRTFGLATSAEGWYYGSMERFEIEAYSPAGGLRRIIRLDVENRPVTPELREEWLRQARERWARLPAPVLEWRLTMPFPETMPAYESAFIVDDVGNLWVPEYKLPTEEPSWVVFDPQGRFLGVVDGLAGGQVTHIGPDFLVGVWTDELDVEQVRMYRLIK
jgi:hypothetical protein